MARANQKIIEALRKVSSKLQDGNHYEWGHMGACNCGHLAQELTNLTKGEIHQFAMQGHGDWTEQVQEFCPTSQLPMDLLISELISNGLSLEDLIQLERLKDPEILKRIPKERRDKMRHNNRMDVALYMAKWAEMLENKIKKKTTATLIVS
jgi:hypothetical protein